VKARIFVEPQEGATYDQLLEVARVVESTGFDALFRSDHLLTMRGSGLPGPTDTWASLAALARETSRIRLGSMLTSATFRLPGPLAVTVAQVDNMSGGRVELGLGAGWYEEEHLAYGIPFPPVAERFERLEEQLAIVSGLWETPVGGSFSFKGKHYQLTGSPALPKPVQQPRPPIIVGGSGAKRTPRLAATFADEYNLPFHELADAAPQFSRVRAACEKLGRDPASLRLSVAQVICCGADEAEVRRRAKAIGREPADLRANQVAGTPDEVVERLLEYQDAGAGTVYLQVLDLDDLDHIRLLSESVLPHLT
jgi:F420-dependent oxidoreductase-like protein